jgi:hypothetical protein
MRGAIRDQLGGRLACELPASGLICDVAMPAARVLADAAGPAGRAPEWSGSLRSGTVVDEAEPSS